MAKRIPVEPAEVRAAVLCGLVDGVDPADLALQMLPFQREHEHTMAEVLLELAADALADSGATREQPVDYRELLDTHLSDYEYRGKVDHRGIYYALTYPAIRVGGVQPDFLTDISWWRTQVWPYALQALVGYVRLAAALTGQSTIEVAQALATRHGIDWS